MEIYDKWVQKNIFFSSKIVHNLSVLLLVQTLVNYKSDKQNDGSLERWINKHNLHVNLS